MLCDKLGERINITTIGQVGKGGGFGRISLGYNIFGHYSPFFGIFSKKRFGKESWVSNMRFYRTPNPRTPAQQAWRAVFRAGKLAWDVLDEGTKDYYRIEGKKKKMEGYNIFMSGYLYSHRL
jgi:hypothetical protein